MYQMVQREVTCNAKYLPLIPLVADVMGRNSNLLSPNEGVKIRNE